MTDKSGSKKSGFLLATAVGASFGVAALLNRLHGGRKKCLVSKRLSSLDYAIKLGKVDVILVLGGGKPITRALPPPWVVSRCNLAAQLFKVLKCPPILTLSAGSAYVGQMINDKGLPVWESKAAALYLVDKHKIPQDKILMETSSYDTIGSAYFARTSFCQVFGWKKLLIITNKFHMSRTRAVFD